jgi:hypothetical protein
MRLKQNGKLNRKAARITPGEGVKGVTHNVSFVIVNATVQ